ncbi:MAG TPA: hypothetical protein VIJ93_14120, partial [bacterium]
MTTSITNTPVLAPFNFQKLAWPSAENALESLKKRTPNTLLHGVPDSVKSFLMAWSYEKLQESQPWLLVTPTREEALILQDDLISWLPGVPVHLCPSWETLPQDVESPDPELVGERQMVFYKLLQGESCIVISPLMGALQCTLPPEEWLEKVLILKKDADAPLDLKERLVAMGYENVTQVVQLGQFAMRGGILDLASPGSPSGPVRLEFFGETLTSIRPLSILNQRSSGDLSQVFIFPAHEIVLDATARQNLKQALRAKVKEESRWANTALELFNQTSRFPGWEWQGLGALEKRGCLFDYLPKEARLFLVEPLAFERRWDDLQERLERCEKQAKEEGSDLFPPQDLFSDVRFLKKALGSGQAAALGQLNQELFQKKAATSQEVLGRSLPSYFGKFVSFASDLKKWNAAGQRVLLWCHNRGERERLSEL